MAPLMDLIAGDRREIVVAFAVEDWASLSDTDRFPAHLSLGGGLDPTWLDLFSEAARAVTGLREPIDFLDARDELDSRATDRLLERIDPAWVAAVAAIPHDELDALAGMWIDLVEAEMGAVGADEKPWIRALAEDLVTFARRAAGARDVIFAWSL
jgi:hypothetical protein